MKLQILIPQNKESDDTVKVLLDSIAIQQNVDFDEIGVIICNDGSDVKLSDKLLQSYPFAIGYYQEPHRGVSATRNACLDRATADYVMFCDADDMFYNAFGLYSIFLRIDKNEFDTYVSLFVEEAKNDKGESVYVKHKDDNIFVHGKVHRRQFLIDHQIRWNDDLYIHEDSYFNILCQSLAKVIERNNETPFYLWRYRPESVCRKDPLYELKTYNDLLKSSTALVNELLTRGKPLEAQYYATLMIISTYYTLQKKEWLDPENSVFRDQTEERFSKYFDEFEKMYESTSTEDKMQIVSAVRSRMFKEGLLLETQTFDAFIKGIKK